MPKKRKKPAYPKPRPSPRTATVIEDIRVDKRTGSTLISVHRAAAELRLRPSALLEHFRSSGTQTELCKRLLDAAYIPETFAGHGIPIHAFGVIVDYYAHEAHRRHDCAIRLARQFCLEGARVWALREIDQCYLPAIAEARELTPEQVQAILLTPPNDRSTLPNWFNTMVDKLTRTPNGALRPNADLITRLMRVNYIRFQQNLHLRRQAYQTPPPLSAH